MRINYNFLFNDKLLKIKHNIPAEFTDNKITKMPYSVFKYEQPATAGIDAYSKGKWYVPFDSPKSKKTVKTARRQQLLWREATAGHLPQQFQSLLPLLALLTGADGCTVAHNLRG